MTADFFSCDMKVYDVVPIAEMGGTRVLFRSMHDEVRCARDAGIEHGPRRHRENDGGRAGAAGSTRMTGAAPGRGAACGPACAIYWLTCFLANAHLPY
jgi:hypothetical protein